MGLSLLGVASKFLGETVFSDYIILGGVMSQCLGTYDLRCLLGDLILFCLGMNFSSGVLGMWFSGSCLLGDIDFGTSFAWGFAWGGFAWVCETGCNFGQALGSSTNYDYMVASNLVRC